MKTRTRRVVLFTGSMVTAWIVASFIAEQALDPGAPPTATPRPGELAPSEALGWRFARAVVAGTIAGLFASFLELRVLPRHARRLGVGAMLIVRTLAYSVVAILAVFATVRFIARRELGVTMDVLFWSEGFQAFLRSTGFSQLILTFVLISFLISGAMQVARLIGPGAATQIFLGRYLRPTREDRLFLFIDLADSTGIAERLGPLAFAEFKNDFFHDIAGPVLDSRGQIVQYVGDEVMITWPRRRKGGAGSGAPVSCFFSLRERVRARAAEYEARYGTAPRFRAGLHAGPVVVSQVGDLKREIAFSGDTVNTASRIQSLCRELGRDFLASRDAVGDVDLPEDVSTEDVGEHSLRGRSEPVVLVALSSTA